MPEGEVTIELWNMVDHYGWMVRQRNYGVIQGEAWVVVGIGTQDRKADAIRKALDVARAKLERTT